MKKFGVIEIASAKTTSAPGWAYVPDAVLAPGTAAAPQHSNRKRARNAPGAGLSLGDLSARQEARIQKEVAALEKDGGKDSSIPVPVRSSRAAGRGSLNVRKILQSQKTFSNHLDDFLALQAQSEGTGTTSNNAARPITSQTSSNKRLATTRKESATPSTKPSPAPELEHAAKDASRPPVLLTPFKPAPQTHQGDSDPLLASRVTPMPTDAELRRLLSHAPLSYLEARGQWEREVEGKARRVFCEVCGYWGRVRCMKCGARICALDCLEVHREECVARYGL